VFVSIPEENPGHLKRGWQEFLEITLINLQKVNLCQKKCKIVVVTTIRKETSLEKFENFCGISIRIICCEIA